MEVRKHNENPTWNSAPAQTQVHSASVRLWVVYSRASASCVAGEAVSAPPLRSAHGRVQSFSTAVYLLAVEMWRN